MKINVSHKHFINETPELILLKLPKYQIVSHDAQMQIGQGVNQESGW